MSDFQDQIPIWEQQEFEKKKPYDFYYNIFVNYYLPMNPKKRTIVQAYRNYLINEENKTVEEVLTITPSPYFYNITQGREYKVYDNILFKFKWADRAAAYDKNNKVNADVENEEYFKAALEKEKIDYDNLSNVFSRALENFSEKLNNEEINREITMMLKDIVDARDKIGEGVRKATGNDKKNTQKITVSDEPDRIEIIWEE